MFSVLSALSSWLVWSLKDLSLIYSWNIFQLLHISIGSFWNLFLTFNKVLWFIAFLRKGITQCGSVPWFLSNEVVNFIPSTFNNKPFILAIGKSFLLISFSSFLTSEMKQTFSLFLYGSSYPLRVVNALKHLHLLIDKLLY